MAVDSARSRYRASRTTVGWVLVGALLYLSLLYAATRVGVALDRAVLELAIPVVALLWGGRDLLRVPVAGPLLLMAALMLLIAGAFDVSGLLTGWPGGDGLVADLFLVAGILVSVWVESGRDDG